jgi:hypothetical protein
MTNWEILIENGFTQLNNGFWVKDWQAKDPNQAKWLTMDEALEILIVDNQ